MSQDKKQVMYRVMKDEGYVNVLIVYGDALIGFEYNEDEEEDFLVLRSHIHQLIDRALETLAEEEVIYDSTKDLDRQLDALLTVEGLDTGEIDN